MYTYEHKFPNTQETSGIDKGLSIMDNRSIPLNKIVNSLKKSSYTYMPNTSIFTCTFSILNKLISIPDVPSSRVVFSH